ncbi:hypothetical protein XMD579_000814 [Marinobacterium sp. xm-d-579]|uniref:DUF2889 domain-containing protein n=1 Tax=Marinobacterium sp. xm-d-579 TaxID=2497734 RepID=UPI0015687127|nr:DUF2889 domain-containing protein [Marinobacterium sp. xm-d-579]NRP36005.1 hypothetical protein [Marinobacterium sp. xm-d-579]
MPLPTPAARTHRHTRQVTCTGYKREDGLWDIEGHLVDTKADEMPLSEFILKAGDPLHDMAIRLTVDLDLNIHAVETTMDATPYTMCPGIAPVYKQLEGESIRPGFTKKVRDLFGGIQGCTHLVELLGPVATTAIQVTFQERHRLAKSTAESPVSAQLNSCHTYAEDSPVVEQYWPELYKG